MALKPWLRSQDGFLLARSRMLTKTLDVSSDCSNMDQLPNLHFAPVPWTFSGPLTCELFSILRLQARRWN